MSKRLCIAGFLFICCLPLAAATVSGVGIVARPRKYDGPCPATIEFIATIRVTHPSRVTYRWVRSDGAEGPKRVVDIHGAGQGVTDSWTLGRGRQNMRIWEQLHVLAPTGIRSARQVVQLRCR